MDTGATHQGRTDNHSGGKHTRTGWGAETRGIRQH